MPLLMLVLLWQDLQEGIQRTKCERYIRNIVSKNYLNVNTLELITTHNAKEIIRNRIAVFANLFDMPAKRILDWCFVQSVLAWVLAMEDSCDASYFKYLIKIFDTETLI
jgi:hypothetical protein